MKKYVQFIFLTVLTLATLSSVANADSLLYGDSCIGDGSIENNGNNLKLQEDQLEFRLNSSLSGYELNYAPSKLICEKIKAHQDELEMVQVALAPAEAVLANPKARDLVLTQLITLGLIYSNPAVVAVTVVGVTGFATVYVIMKKTMAQCLALEKEALNKALIHELSQTYRFQGNPELKIGLP